MDLSLLTILAHATDSKTDWAGQFDTQSIWKGNKLHKL